MSLGSIEIDCPDCGKVININEQISHHLQEGMDDERKSIEIQIRKELKQNHDAELESIKEKLSQKESELRTNKDSDLEKESKSSNMNLTTQTSVLKSKRRRQFSKGKNRLLLNIKKWQMNLLNRKQQIFR